jgi:hypothetical protein
MVEDDRNLLVQRYPRDRGLSVSHQPSRLQSNYRIYVPSAGQFKAGEGKWGYTVGMYSPGKAFVV